MSPYVASAQHLLEVQPIMPRGRSGNNKAPSLMGEFRAIFQANPKLLKRRSNKEVAQIWLNDHPQHKELPENAKSSLANVKSVLRSKRRRRKKAEREAGQPVPVRVTKPKAANLVTLETQIDDCMIFAKTLDRVQLDSVIKHLRDARNQVVWMLGE
jgi:hypothetical protein